MIAIFCCTCFLVVFALVVLLIVLWLQKKDTKVEKKKVYCEDCIHCWGNSIDGYVCHYTGHTGGRETLSGITYYDYSIKKFNEKNTPYGITYYYYPIKKFNKKNNCEAFEPNSRKRDTSPVPSPRYRSW